MKKYFIIIFIIIGIVGVLIFNNMNYIKLKIKGYSSNDIAVLKDNLNNDEIKLIMNSKYINKLVCSYS